MVAHSPIKWLGEPAEIAATIVFVLSNGTEWVSGQEWRTNGAMMMTRA